MDAAARRRQVSGVAILLEACLDSAMLAKAAEDGGARRIELCDRLDIGGTTPSAELIRSVAATVRIPIYPIIRPRGGDFLYTAPEIDAMKRDAASMRKLGATGIVVGILDREHRVDRVAMRQVIEAADGLPVGFHLAFEQVPDQSDALETLIEIGIERVLTKGGGATALEGVNGLRALVRQAKERIAIMAGGSVREQNVGQVVRRSGVREIHTKGLAIAQILAHANAAESAPVIA
jgi:copper homeostasis protein